MQYSSNKLVNWVCNWVCEPISNEGTDTFFGSVWYEIKTLVRWGILWNIFVVAVTLLGMAIQQF